MSKMMFATKLAASTRKAKEINGKPAASTSRSKKIIAKSAEVTASTSKTEKNILKTEPKLTSLTEVACQKDLLDPVDLALSWKKRYLVRIWPD